MGASGTRAGVHGSLELFSHARELTNALTNFFEMHACDLVDLTTRECGIVRQRQQASDFLETEAEFSPAGDKSQSLDFVRAIGAVAALGAGGPR